MWSVSLSRGEAEAGLLGFVAGQCSSGPGSMAFSLSLMASWSEYSFLSVMLDTSWIRGIHNLSLERMGFGCFPKLDNCLGNWGGRDYRPPVLLDRKARRIMGHGVLGVPVFLVLVFPELLGYLAAECPVVEQIGVLPQGLVEVPV